MCLEMPPFMSDLAASCALNEFMSVARGMLFLPCSGLLAKQRVEGSCDTYPRHSLVAELCQSEGSARHALVGAP